MNLNLPNLLTLSRILMIPIFVGLFFLPEPVGGYAAAAVFLIASVTDWLDGYLARRMQLVTPMGAFLDPVADKLIVATALVLVVKNDPTALLSIAAIIIIGREITVSALREWMAEIGARAQVAVSTIGKFKTAAQMVAILLLLYREPIFGLPVFQIGQVLLYIAAVLTIWSMMIYLLAAWPKLKARG